LLCTSYVVEALYGPYPAPLPRVSPGRTYCHPLSFFCVRHTSLRHGRPRGLFPWPTPRRNHGSLSGEVHHISSSPKIRSSHRLHHDVHALCSRRTRIKGTFRWLQRTTSGNRSRQTRGVG